MSRLIAATLALVCALPVGAFTEGPPDPSAPAPNAAPARPKIALVLGGGGARGYAHIGVLQYFDEHHIPIDILTGTSMGGLIGGTYAMGTSPSDMKSIIDDINWSHVFIEDAPYHDESFRRKEDDREYAVDLQLGLEHGPSLPPGLYPAQPINLLLDRLSLPYSGVRSFEDLAIPFRCVATDIVTGEQVTMGNGTLADALRATMSIPGFFTPVRREGHLLVDGGLVDNVPVDVAKDMGADIVIAVDVGTPLFSEEKLTSALEVSSQALSVMMINHTKRILKSATMVISPDLGTYGTTDFTKCDEIVKIGYDAAAGAASTLQAYAVDDATWSAYVAERDARIRKNVPVPTFVAIRGVTGLLEKEAKERFEDLVGKPLNTKEVDLELTKLMGTGRYETATYGLTSEGGKEGIEVLLVPKTYGPPFIRFGAEISNAQSAGANITLKARITYFDPVGSGSEGRVDIGFGSDNFLNGELFKPVGESGFFVAPRLGVDAFTEDIFQGDDRIARYRIILPEAGFDVGYQTRNSEVRFGGAIDYVNAVTTIGSPVLPDLKGFASQVRAKYVYDDQDQPLIPEHGLRLQAEARNIFDGPITPNNIPQLIASASEFVPAGKRGTLTLRFLGGTTLGPGATPAFDFTLGGPFQMSAYKLDQFRGDNVVYFSPGYLYKLGSLPDIIGGNYYIGGFYEVGSAFNDWDTRDFKNDGTVAFLVNTKIGLIGIGGSIGENGHSRFIFTLGSIVR